MNTTISTVYNEKMSDPAYKSTVTAPTAPVIAVPMGTAESGGKEKITSKNAERSCLFGILSFFCCTLCISPYAIHLGLRAKKEIKKNPNEVTGNCEANSGIATASIALVVWVIVMIFVIRMYLKEVEAMYGN